MTWLPASPFVETSQHRHFAAFCEECRRRRCIGMCYGPPGVGKTWSARQVTCWDKIASYQRYGAARGVTLSEVAGRAMIFYTLPTRAYGNRAALDLAHWRRTLRGFLSEVSFRHWQDEINELKRRQDDERRQALAARHATSMMLQAIEDRMAAAIKQSGHAYHSQPPGPDPTDLIIIDEADRLTVGALPRALDRLDEQQVGVVLLARPWFEQQLARQPHLYTRIPLRHAFEPLPDAEIRSLLADAWCHSGELCDAQCAAAIVQIAGGNLRRLFRLLAHIARIAEARKPEGITGDVVRAAWDCLPADMMSVLMRLKNDGFAVSSGS